MISYAGVNLTVPSVQFASWIASNISLSDLIQHNPAPYLNKLLTSMPYPDQRQRPIKVSSLWWPQGASRWAVGHFIATESKLTALRAICYPYSAAQPLIMNDGLNNVTTNMWMLPPRPLAQKPINSTDLTKWLIPRSETWRADSPAGIGEPVYLLTLVDDRFFWWEKPSSVIINVGTTTWATLIAAIGSALGVSITTDTIQAAYLKPTAALIQFLPYLPLLLDLAAFAVGMHCVRGYDGSVKLQNATNAIAAQANNLSSFKVDRVGGGLLAIDVA